jgi:hypothetical protein
MNQRRCHNFIPASSVKVHGNNSLDYVSEKEGVRPVCEITADYTRRIISVKSLQTGQIKEVAFEQCKEWQPYTDAEQAALEEAELEKATAPKRKGAAA